MSTNKKRKIGRPPLPKGERRELSLFIRLNQNELKTVQQAAAKEKISAWARKVVVQEAERIAK